MCPGFHVDRVGIRLVCAYVGPGTEWLPEPQVDRVALGRREPGGVLRLGAPARLAIGAVGLLKGEAWPGNEGRGAVHRSPPVAAGERRVLLTIEGWLAFQSGSSAAEAKTAGRDLVAWNCLFCLDYCICVAFTIRHRYELVTMDDSSRRHAMNREDRLTLLARAWDDGAIGYDAYFVPRLVPWVEQALRALAGPLPSGIIAVPCCGTGPELERLAHMHPAREIAGVDLSPGMVQLARQRTRGSANVRVYVADATHTDSWPPCAGIISAFGLQQMPEPVTAVASWTRALVAGGTLSVVYWPAQVEQDGPFAWMAKALSRRLPQPDLNWEMCLSAAIRDAGATVLRDEILVYEMSHECPRTFWDAALDSGPGRALALSQGEAFLQEVRADFFRRAPDGPIRHRPQARHLVARRDGLQA
jgi:SAM-dependent methyltransferase